MNNSKSVYPFKNHNRNHNPGLAREGRRSSGTSGTQGTSTRLTISPREKTAPYCEEFKKSHSNRKPAETDSKDNRLTLRKFSSIYEERPCQRQAQYFGFTHSEGNGAKLRRGV